MGRPLTPRPYRTRADKAIAYRASGMNQSQSMIKAGYKPASAWQFFRRPEIQSRLTLALEKARPGIVDMAAQKIVDALDATRAMVVFQGNDNPSVIEHVPDHPIRLLAVDKVISSFGMVPGKMELPDPPPRPISITFNLHPSARGEPDKSQAVEIHEKPPPLCQPFVLRLKKP